MMPMSAMRIQEKNVNIRPTGQRRIQRVSPCMPGRNIQNKAVGMLNSEQYWKICRAAHVLGDVRSHQSQCLNARIRKRCKLERRAAFADGFSRMPLALSSDDLSSRLAAFESVPQSNSLGGFLENPDIPPGRAVWLHTFID